MSNLINNVRISNKAFFKKEEKPSFKNQGLLTGAFSFGAVSLISACSNDSAGGGGDTGEGPDPYVSKVNLDAPVATLDSLEHDNTGVTELIRGSGSTGIYKKGVTVNVAGGSIALDNITYSKTATFIDSSGWKTYNEIDGEGGKDLIFYGSNFYQDAPFSDTPTVDTSGYGGVTIIWDLPTDETSFNNSNGTADLKYLHISGHRSGSFSGLDSVEILEINTGSDLMITATLATVADDRTTAGAIHIFWDVANYKSQGTGKANISTDNADKNFLSIYGASSGDQIQAPQLVKLTDANKHDLVLSSGGAMDSAGAIYILWDVASYDSGRKIIDLADTASANQGLLAIYGNSGSDLLQLTNGFNPFHHVDDNKNFDLVIHQNSERVDGTHVGAIYILWDVGSYASTEHKAITLDATLDADSGGADYGLFSIIGENGKGLDASAIGATNQDNYPLLTETMDTGGSIAKDLNGGGKKDIAFKYDGKTYVIFGEVMAEKNDVNIIKSKTIDLATVTATGGYFNYDFGDEAVAKNVGYVFAGSYNYLDVVPAIPAPAPTAPLSETFESHDYWIV